MGGSSSRHTSLESEDAGGVVLVKGIRMTDRVIDRMKQFPPPQHPQSKSSTCPTVGQPSTPESGTLAPAGILSPVLPHPPSYASALVSPPLEESINPHVSVSQESPAPPASTPTVETVPSVTFTAPESAPDSVLSVKEHKVVFPPSDSVPSSPTESLPIITCPLNFTEPVVLPLPADHVPIILSSSDEAVNSSPPPVTNTVKAPPTTEFTTPSIDATRIPFTNNVPIAPPVKSTLLPTILKPTDMPVESSVPSTYTLTLDTTISVKQVKLPTTPSSGSELQTKISFSPDTAIPTSIQSVETSTDIPPIPFKPRDLPSDMETLPPPPSSALSEFCKVSSGCFPNEGNPAPAVTPAAAQLRPSLTEAVVPASSPQAAVTEEVLRKHIREELQKVLKKEMIMSHLKFQKQLEEKSAKDKAEVQTFVQEQIQAEVQKVLEKEQLAFQLILKDVIMQERKTIQDEQLASQYYWVERKIQKLKTKERDLVKQDTVYTEQIVKHEEKIAQIVRVTAESFKKGLEETHKRFMRYQNKPVCSELQNEILQCYLQNTGQTMKCSNIALQYVKCVNNTKQNKKLNTGG